MRIYQKTDGVTTLASFLKNTEKFPVIALVSEEYPLLFVQKFFKFLQEKYGIAGRTLDLAQIPLEQVQAQLAMGFFGQRFLYFLGDMSQLRATESKALLKILQSYQGPHTLLVFAGKEPIGKTSKNSLTPSAGSRSEPVYRGAQSADLLGEDGRRWKGTNGVEVGGVFLNISILERINFQDYEGLLFFLPEPDRARVRFVLQKIFAKTGVLSLEQAVRLTDYALVLGARHQEAFVSNWLHIIAKPESSLFQLSSALFARDTRSFWTQWKQITPDYEFPFWLSYFSDQFFRAYFFLVYRQEGNLELAKKISYRLPFSFIQRDFRKHTPAQLLAAHTRLCELDHHLKTGGSTVALESVFTKFF